MEINQLVTAVKAVYQMLIAVNLARNTCHVAKYQQSPVKTPEPEDRLNDLLEFELGTVHYRHDG